MPAPPSGSRLPVLRHLLDASSPSAGSLYVRECPQVPLTGLFVIAKHVQRAVIRATPETAFCWAHPAVDNLEHFQPAFTKPERTRFLLAAIARITVDLDFHDPLHVIPCHRQAPSTNFILEEARWQIGQDKRTGRVDSGADSITMRSDCCSQAV